MLFLQAIRKATMFARVFDQAIEMQRLKKIQ